MQGLKVASNLAFLCLPGIVNALIETATEIVREESVNETVVIASENAIEIASVSVTAIAKRNAGNTGVGRARKIVTAIETGESCHEISGIELPNFYCHILKILY